MLPSIMRDTVTRVRAGVKTLRGQYLPDWDNATSISISGCSMQPSSTSLDQDGKVLAFSDSYTLYAPASADIKAGDRITFNNKTYTIMGDVREWPSASGTLDHLTVQLTRWEE